MQIRKNQFFRDEEIALSSRLILAETFTPQYAEQLKQLNCIFVSRLFNELSGETMFVNP
jgi:hypothetical protein